MPRKKMSQEDLEYLAWQRGVDVETLKKTLKKEKKAKK